MPSREYDFWLLDLDGTLVDIEERYIHELLDEVGDRLGTEFTDREAEAMWYGFGGERDRVLEAKGLDRDQFWDAFHEAEEPQARAASTHLYDDAADVVPELQGPVGLVTHCQRFLTEPVLETLDIDDWFDTVVCCTDETGWKPDPTPVEMVMGELGVAGNGHEGVLVGDDPNDIGAAWNAGLTAVHVRRRDPATVGHCVTGDRRVSSFRDL